MDPFQAALLGLVQGLTEFLPVSSSGHLILFEAWGGIKGTLAFDAFIHLGTLGAVLFYFRRDWKEVLKSFTQPGWGRKLFFMLAIGTLPGALAGVLFEDLIAAHFRTPSRVALMLVLMSLPLLGGELRHRSSRDLSSLGLKGAFLIGLAQALALIPGTSRSGITMAAGLLLGLSRIEAAHFSFLLSAPIIAGAGAYEGLKLLASSQVPLSTLFIGAGSALFSGWLAISFLLNFLRRHTFYPFIVYRVLLAGTVYAFL